MKALQAEGYSSPKAGARLPSPVPPTAWLLGAIGQMLESHPTPVPALLSPRLLHGDHLSKSFYVSKCLKL